VHRRLVDRRLVDRRLLNCLRDDKDRQTCGKTIYQFENSRCADPCRCPRISRRASTVRNSKSMYQSIPAHNSRHSPATRPNSNQSYVPSIDGLRSIAVLIVVFFHAGVPIFEIGGYYGVDIFFIISGYIITKINIGRFQQRIIQILDLLLKPLSEAFPPLFCVGLTLLLISTTLSDTSQAITDIGATFGHIANWTRAYALGAPKYLGHTWSLSIEEQYYLIWPVLLFFSYRHGGSKLT